MIRAAIVLQAAALVLAITLPPSMLARYVILAVAGIGTVLAILAPRPAAEPHSRSRRRTATGTVPARLLLDRIPAQRDDGPRIEIDDNGPRWVRGPFDADDPRVAHQVPAAARARVDRG